MIATHDWYYLLKGYIPRWLQISIRRKLLQRKIPQYRDVWPIDETASKPPENWQGWPDGKKFALVLTHDVETEKGLKKCHELMKIEERVGFRSSFNFVAGDYEVPTEFIHEIKERGFEIGLHGLHHIGNMYRSKKIFSEQAAKINPYFKKWGAVGFRTPSMYHNLEYIHDLNIEYDASTFDTDPFEPQSDGAGTIFPFWVPGRLDQKGYVELPYTLAQDFLLFILMQEKNIDIWKTKLDWIVQHGGMALVNTHPDYMNFNKNTLQCDEFPSHYYEEFLTYIKTRYDGVYWHALPKDMAHFWSQNFSHKKNITRDPLHVCMLVYSFYESDNRVMRYAETLAQRGDQVDVIALRQTGQPLYSAVRGVNVYRIQKRMENKKEQLSFLYKLTKFLIMSSIFLAKRHFKNPYHVIHVHNVPDFLVFATLFPKLFGTKVILDIHDIVPELYATMFNKTKNSFLFKSVLMIEKASCGFSDHVIIANDIWHKLIITRSVNENKCSVVLNYPDENIFFERAKQRQDDKFIMIYPGSLNRRQGVDIAIKALALIKDELPMVEFHIYGYGADRNYLEHLACNLGLQNQVFFKGILPIYEVAEKMANADLGIEPKRNDMFAGDAMSTKILEFISLGIPVIASDTRIHKHYFNESVVLFFKSDDEHDLARCMLSLIRDKELRAHLNENHKQFIENFRWDKRKHEYFDVIDSLVNLNRKVKQ